MPDPTTTKPNAVLLRVDGIAPFIVWSARPLAEAATALLADAEKLNNATNRIQRP